MRTRLSETLRSPLLQGFHPDLRQGGGNEARGVKIRQRVPSSQRSLRRSRHLQYHALTNSLASISAAFWFAAGFAHGGGNARMQEIRPAFDQLAISWPSGPNILTKSEHGRPFRSINCSDMVSISNCPRQLNSLPSNWKDSSIFPLPKCSTR